jgi:predicted dehydrogenase
MAIRLVQVGMGSWGRNWATHVIKRSEDVELVACVDLDAEALVQAQQLLSMSPERCFQTLESALASVVESATSRLPVSIAVRKAVS